MLQGFLELDRPLRARSQEKALLGVRKAQVKLACYLPGAARSDKARTHLPTTWQDEPRERLLAIRQQLESVDEQGLLGDHRPRPQLRVHAR